ncbi:tRNA glutamyl-Q(34) synthetase GluQRS [Bifidobacterium sp. CP2]|uniref:glutamate--tRNA ligase family protein n=1 Tax=Bifidobacterium TaxID=1678 RepID=UPI001BDC0822|nr:MULTISPECIES: glutamate--tRNA ligase family protein [Bifidobacterium]MBT1181477.1 tRNA glutamyl-Q(34) synthetase GluQRS [Bifidobacterium sp. CP2]MBW3081581.1 tRNA glutamyl-Q(34) synthetase GluQRS [Bifidobacterium saguinibicoloris]
MTGRFAPTPSGRMHIGNMTAMLAAWLDSRAHGGRMLLRIEDIDTPRVLPDADRWIMDDLAWLGLDWDGEPVYQSRRLDLYEQALRLLEPQTVDGDPLVYPCFCSRADIRAASAPQEGDGFQIYPGTCRRLMRDHPDEVAARLARGDRHSLRIAMPCGGAACVGTGADGGTDGAVTVDDRVYGPQTFDLAHDIGDSVIRRSDGLFGYQFVVTVDDLAMGVDSVVRGRDLLRSAALQSFIRGRLIAGGFPAAASSAGSLSDSDCIASPAHPVYTHIPLIDNAAGRRLAKRERSLDMGALRRCGVTAEQVTGVCAWLLRLVDRPEPCTAHDLLDTFRADGWEPLRADHTDRRLDPDDPHMPAWLAGALRNEPASA